MRISVTVCGCLLLPSSSSAQNQPAVPAVTISKPLADQPANKPISHRQAIAADNAYLEGSAYIQKNEPEKAQKAFEKAAKLNPEKQEYAVAAAIARENVIHGMVRKSQVMRSAGNTAGAEALLAAAAKLDPQNDLVLEHMRQPEEPQLKFEPASGSPQKQYAPVIELVPEAAKQSFHFRADAHETLRRVLLAYGIKAQFNTDVPSTSTRIDVDDVDFDKATDILEMMTHTFLVPIDPKTAMVLKDTPENHEQFDHLSLENIYMPGYTPEQIHDASTMLQQVLDLQKVTVTPHNGIVSIRAPQEMLKIANYQLADLMDGGNQLALEMKVYTIDKSRTRNMGVNVPQSVSAYNVASQVSQLLSQYQSQIAALIANGTIPAGASLTQIAVALITSGIISNPLISGTVAFLGGSLNSALSTTNPPNPFAFTGISAPSPFVLNLALNSSESKSLEDMQLRVGDNKTATFRVGTKYPIITASYSSGGVSSSLLAGVSASQLASLGISSAAAAAAATQVNIPQIQYEDLGLTLKATPTVLRSGNVSLKLDLKIEALAGSSLNNIPVLASRALVSNVTIPEGQTVVLVSSMTKQESNAVSGIPGLSEIPGFQDTTDSDKAIDTSELVITLTPRLVRRGRNHMASIPLAFPRTVAARGHDDE